MVTDTGLGSTGKGLPLCHLKVHCRAHCKGQASKLSLYAKDVRDLGASLLSTKRSISGDFTVIVVLESTYMAYDVIGISIRLMMSLESAYGL